MTTPTLKIKITPAPKLRGKMDVRFPANVEALSPIVLDKSGGNYTFSIDLDEITANLPSLDSDLTALASNSTNGLWARTGAGTGAARTITGTANAISVTNGDGVSGNPTLAISSDAALPGNPTTTTQAVDNNTTRVATTAYVVSQAAAAAPLGNAPSAVVGTSTRFARADHVHPGREVLTANRTYYVRTDGSNSNTGLVNTSGGAFLTIQKAISVIEALDISTFNVTIQVGDGTYTGAINVSAPWVGSGLVSIIGNTTTPANVVLSTSGATITAASGGRIAVNGFKVASSGGHGIFCTGGGSSISVGANMTFDTCAEAHMRSDANGYISGSSCSVVGGATQHLLAVNGGIFELAGGTVTITGTPTIGTMAYAQATGLISCFSMTYSGAISGTKYNVSGNSVINTFGGGSSVFPGTGTSATTGGQYL